MTTSKLGKLAQSVSENKGVEGCDVVQRQQLKSLSIPVNLSSANFLARFEHTGSALNGLAVCQAILLGSLTFLFQAPARLTCTVNLVVVEVGVVVDWLVVAGLGTESKHTSST